MKSKKIDHILGHFVIRNISDLWFIKLHYKDILKTCWEIFKNHEIMKNVKLCDFQGHFSNIYRPNPKENIINFVRDIRPQIFVKLGDLACWEDTLATFCGNHKPVKVCLTARFASHAYFSFLCPCISSRNFIFMRLVQKNVKI